jgi:hypothetical protein
MKPTKPLDELVVVTLTRREWVMLKACLKEHIKLVARQVKDTVVGPYAYQKIVFDDRVSEEMAMYRKMGSI